MDHVYDAIANFYDIYLDEFVKEHKKGNYEKLSDNPGYTEIKTIIESMNVLGKYLGYENVKLSEAVKWGLEKETVYEKVEERIINPGFEGEKNYE